ncbi:MAG: V-type ATP synthase subunit I [Candidatus Altiarchaeota archaeon]|nr:V-type ATP synthase subunit I [Candidatus Altiarchaeota archaeon]
MDCLVAKDSADALVFRLHAEGLTQLGFIDDDFLVQSSISRDIPPQRLSAISLLAGRVKKSADSLAPYGAGDGDALAGLLEIDVEPKIPVLRMTFAEVERYANDALVPVEAHIGAYHARLREIDTESHEKRSLSEKLLPLKGAGLSGIQFGESAYLTTVLGTVPAEGYGQLEANLSKASGGCFLLLKAAGSDDIVHVVVSVLRRDSDALDEALRRSRFTRIAVDVESGFDDALLEAEQSLERLAAEKSGIETSLGKLNAEHYRKLLAVLELLEFERQRCEAFRSFGATERLRLLRLWVPLKDSSRVEGIIRGQTNGRYAVNSVVDAEGSPVLLSNPKWLRPFEPLTKMFSTPNYGQVDPTALLAPTFILFFGMMFSDVVYGILLIAAAYYLYKKYAAKSDSAKGMSVVLSYFGLSAIFFGLLTGSFLGDFVGKYVLGSENGSQAIALWLDPLYNGNMLVYIPLVFAIGFVHIFIGYLVGALDSIRRRQYRTAIVDYISLMLLPLGLGAYAFKGMGAGLLVSLASLILVFMGSGIMGLYLKVSGMLGSVVSYARLLALMASSSGISMTVNFMTSISLSAPYIGIPLAAAVFVGGHIINIALNMIGAFVHTLRLHYVEFFGTFYEGGGTAFEPFREERKYSLLIKQEV